MRFVLLSLVVMTFAFYELSGGDDFVPRSDLRRAAAQNTPVQPQQETSRVAVASLATETTATRSGTARTQALAGTDTPQSTSALITAAAAPNSLFQRETLDRPEVTLVSLEQSPALFANPVSPDRAPEAVNSVTVSPSLASAVASPVTGAPDPSAAPRDAFDDLARDIRAVTGNRVNMRGGPGTSYTVLAQLNQNTKVEILADPGTGWVKLRPLAGGPEGWMADYLLTNANG